MRCCSGMSRSSCGTSAAAAARSNHARHYRSEWWDGSKWSSRASGASSGFGSRAPTRTARVHFWPASSSCRSPLPGPIPCAARSAVCGNRRRRMQARRRLDDRLAIPGTVEQASLGLPRSPRHEPRILLGKSLISFDGARPPASGSAVAQTGTAAHEGVRNSNKERTR